MPRKALGATRTAFKAALTKKNKHVASPATVFPLTGRGDVDPFVAVVKLRVMAMRRMFCAFPEGRAQADAALQAYQDRGFPGTVAWEGQRVVTEIGLPEAGSESSAFGPVGLLLLTFARCGVSVDGSWNATDEHGIVVPLAHAPWQHLKGWPVAIADRARTWAAAHTRRPLAAPRGPGVAGNQDL